MEIHRSDISKVCKKLKQIQGVNNKQIDIPFIETLCGNYSGQNILEGFSANTDILCNERSEHTAQYDQDFYNMCVRDNEIIFDITAQAQLNILDMLEKKH